MRYLHHGRCDRSGVLLRANGLERGAALLFALLAVLVTAMAVGAIARFCVQDNSLALVQANSCAALDTAEAALHWELSKMSRAEYDPTVQVDEFGAPFTGGPAAMAALWGANGFGGNVMPIAGTASTYVMADDPNPRVWNRPGDFRIFASGTVNGATRSIVASGTAVGLADTYTLYGINGLAFTGAGVKITGMAGTAGACNAAAPVDPQSSATVVFDRLGGVQGSWAVPNAGLSRWVASPLECMFPTVNAIAGRAATRIAGAAVADGIGYFATHNDDMAFVFAKYNDGSTRPVPFPVGGPYAVNAALYTANNNVDGKQLVAIQLVGNPAVLPNGLARGSSFYFDEFQIPTGKTLEVVNDAAHGPVRVWLGPARRAPGAVQFGFQGNSTLHVTDFKLGSTASHTNFQIYNATGVPFIIGNVTGRDGLGFQGVPSNWNNGWPGLFFEVYAFNTDANGGYGAIQVSDNLTLRGTLIGWNVRQTAGTLDAALPSGAGSRDWIGWVLYYRLRGQWVETDTSGARIDALRGSW